jgi:hypothetical protein
MTRRKIATAVAVWLAVSSFALGQSAPGLLSADEVKKVAPAGFFFAGQSASVQLRNTGGVRTSGGIVLAGLVDNSGYASDVAAKYQGFLITETKLNIGNFDLAPGAYGFGFTKEGKFLVMDVGNHEILSTEFKTDGDMKRPVPLKFSAGEGGYRLYAGRKWVEIKTP